jgi:uncharacterized damage-inducible protein DinB
MNSIELILKELTGSPEWLKMTIGDMTDADMLTRPVPAANHPLYQLGHLCAAEVHLMSYCKKGIHSDIPADLGERFGKEASKENDLKKLGTKDELLALHAKIRAQTIAYAKTLKESDLDVPTNVPFAPTVGQMLTLMSSHIIMHMGQMQVARRALGKPILF